MEIKAFLHNEFDIIVRDKEGNVKAEGKSYNVILNQFWTHFLSSSGGSATLARIFFGSGTATPLATDTGLTTFVGQKIATDVSTDYSEYLSNGIVKIKKTIRLEASENVGLSLSEVGFGSGTGNSTLRTKSLIKDTNGNPLTILKGDTDVIDIFGTVYIKLPGLLESGLIKTTLPGDVEYGSAADVLVLKNTWGTTHTPMFNNSKAEIYQIMKSFATSRDSRYSVSSPITFDIPNKKAIISIPDMAAATANDLAGIGSVALFGHVLIGLPVTGFTQPVITKEVIGAGDGTKKDFPCKFGYIKNNGTAKAYINDVETAATIDYMVPRISKAYIHAYMNIISCAYTSIGEVDRSAPAVFENPYYDRYPIDAFYGSYFNVYCSDNGTDWTLAGSHYSTSLSTVSISAGNQNKRYWKVEPYGATTYWKIQDIRCAAYASGYNMVHFASAPAAGATVALTYQPDCIAKDDQHLVKNVKFEFVFNEYTP